LRAGWRLRSDLRGRLRPSDRGDWPCFLRRSGGRLENSVYDAAAQHRKGSLGDGFTDRSTNGQGYCRITIRCRFDILQEAGKQLPLPNAEDALVLHQSFRKSVEDLLRRHRDTPPCVCLW
jgi:hypothetical protein